MLAVITGATKGIGKAIAEAFAAEGFDIALCARSAQDLENQRRDLRARFPGIEVFVKKADLAKKTEVLAFAHFVQKTGRPVDVLVNNAGLFIPGSVRSEPEGTLENLMAVNLYSAYHLTRALLPPMLERRSGHIFNICSIASIKSYPNGGAYSITKFALHGLSKNLREELKDKGIRVTSVLPGATWTASWAGVELPEERLMQAADVALAVLNAWKLSRNSVVEEIVLRPQLGDL